MPKWLKTCLKILFGLIALFVFAFIGLLVYVALNKDRVLKVVSSELNQNLDGTITIGDLHQQFFKRFPQVSLELKNVQIRDKQFARHHHTLLNAKEFYVSLNSLSLFSGKAKIERIDIGQASVDLYTDSTGYSNLSVFRKGKKKPKGITPGKTIPPEFQQFSFSQVELKVDDRKKNKLFYFHINSLEGKMQSLDSGWKANVQMSVLAKNMSFKTKNGSFIKNKTVTGYFSAIGNDDGRIDIQSDALDIGPNVFKMNAVFGANKRPADFAIHLSCDQITWKQASELLANNIKRKLDKYNISKPVSVTARIEGSFAGGNPFLYITAKVRDSQVSTPAVELDNCNFNAVFTNNYKDGKGFTDDNSVIRIVKFTGSYQHIPFAIDAGDIVDLNNTIAMGNLRASFPVTELNALLGNKIARFTKGHADILLRYKGDIINYRLNKPMVTGYINIRNADVIYLPEKLKVVNSSISMNITQNSLVLRNIRLQTGHSVVEMNGRVRNFMNLYYNDPEKILLIWQIHSPQLYLGEFIGFLSGGEAEPVAKEKPTANSSDAIDQLSNVLQKSTTAMHLDVDKLHYFKFLATDVHADLLTSQNAVVIKNAGLKHAGGFLKLSGAIKKGIEMNKATLNTTISHVDVREFFEAFDNFGLSDFTSSNLKGYLSAKTQITAGLTDDGKLIKNSINGTLDVNLQDGALIDFKPIYKIGKFAFPFRNLKDIRIRELNARFDVNGDIIKVYPLKLSSSAINMDVEGTYGLTKGTDLAIDVPLRNPKKDTTIADPEKLEKKRYKGIVLHLLAKADSTGKVKIGLNKERKKE